VDGVGEHLLAGAAFTRQKYRGCAFGHFYGDGLELFHPLAPAHNAVNTVLGAHISQYFFRAYPVKPPARFSTFSSGP
jgi:hypothetical protein